MRGRFGPGFFGEGAFMNRAERPSQDDALVSGLPDDLAPLGDLARNLWWAWNPEAAAVFEAAGGPKWESVGRNPVLLIRKLGDRQLERLSGDRAFIAAMKKTHRRMRSYLSARTWYQSEHGRPKGLVAYFSMEFGLHESLPIYAGGLGVLAGDHLKSASDLGLPLVGVGILWRQGYTRQVLTQDGKQKSAYPRVDPAQLPLTEAKGSNGRPVRVSVYVGKDEVLLRAWRLEVGRVPLYLLDADLEENKPKHRRLTQRLYQGDRDARIRQEIVLGIGGWKLFRELGAPVKVCHLNEGHAAFCALERIAQVIRAEDCTFKQAARKVSASTVFTTHTPVPAGNETFDPALVKRYFDPHLHHLRIQWEDLLALGRVDAKNDREPFGMTPLALRLADKRNGVAQLHGEVSRKMWQGVWPKRSAEKVPIGAITNGIHLRTWLHPRMAELLDEFLPEGWEQDQDRTSVWKAAGRIPDDRLWSLHEALKGDLVAFVRQRLLTQGKRNRAGDKELQAAEGALDPEALTLGFARRFAPYKRATLIFSQVKRFEKLARDTKRPLQIIFAGKAHPADEAGQKLVAEIARHARSPRFRGRVVLLEDYDINVARHMVAGVDVWLNNPRRPQEASGTSGMKPTLHGGLNLSVLDGWWPEGCQEGVNGWAIGAGKDHSGKAADDKKDAEALYRRLERDVIPRFYRRDAAGLPREWIKMMKASMQSVPQHFNSHRMVKEYLRKYYQPMLSSTAKR